MNGEFVVPPLGGIGRIARRHRDRRLKPVLRARAGYSLVELMAVMSGMAVVVGGAIVLMQLMLGMSGEVRQRTYAIAMLGRLAEQFRRDVHNAQGEPRVAADHVSAEIGLPGGETVRWETNERGELCRRESVGQKSLRENTYSLPKGTSATFALQKQGPARIVALRDRIARRRRAGAGD